MLYSYPNAPAEEILRRDPELKTHLNALALASVDEYIQWCAQHGFSTRLDKHWRQRGKERYFAAEQKINQRVAGRKKEKRQPGQIIDLIFRGQVEEADLNHSGLQLIHRLVGRTRDAASREAYAQLLRCVDGQIDLLSTKQAHWLFPTNDDNTIAGGLLAVATCHDHWQRTPRMWTPNTRNRQRLFSSLVDHLLAGYRVPGFMNSVWFRGNDCGSQQQQRWYTRLAAGESPRALDLPIRLTKSMSRHFLAAPQRFSVEAAIRRGQVMGLGGHGRLVTMILGSRIGTDFEANEFWESVIRWLIRHSSIDPANVGPLIDYIHQRRFDDDVDDAESFSMKQRTPESLIRQMRQWHATLRELPNHRSDAHWFASGIRPFDWSEGAQGTGGQSSDNLRRWTIIELMSRKQLYEEGRTMRHCVATYDNHCAFGTSSIWSLGLERNLLPRRRVLTIEVRGREKLICQVRGKANRLPTEKEMEVIRRWAEQEDLRIAEFVRWK